MDKIKESGNYLAVKVKNGSEFAIEQWDNRGPFKPGYYLFELKGSYSGRIWLSDDPLSIIGLLSDKIGVDSSEKAYSYACIAGEIPKAEWNQWLIIEKLKG